MEGSMRIFERLESVLYREQRWSSLLKYVLWSCRLLRHDIGHVEQVRTVPDGSLVQVQPLAKGVAGLKLTAK